MVDIDTNLKGLVLSAVELREMTDWPEALIEDYLTVLETLISLAEGVTDAATKVPGADEDNIIVFDSSGDLKDSGTSIDEIGDGSTRRAYFYGRSY